MVRILLKSGEKPAHDRRSSRDLCRRRGFGHLCAAALSAAILFGGFTVLRARGEEAETLVQILKARDGAVSSFSADLDVSERSAPGRQQFVRAKRNLARWWRNVAGDEARARSHEEMADMLDGEVERRARYRYYFSDMPPRVRTELVSEERPAANGTHRKFAPTEPTLYIYTSDRWKTFSPAAWSRSSQPLNELQITNDNRVAPFAFEVARGSAVPLYAGMGEAFDVSPSAKALAQIRWTELLKWMHPAGQPHASAEESAVWGRTLVELTPPPPKNLNIPQFRIRVWLDATHGYCLRRFVTEAFRENELTGVSYYIPIIAADWDEVSVLATTGDLPLHCTFHLFTELLMVTANEPFEKWPSRAFELTNVEVRMSNVNVGAGLPDKLFNVSPPVGTNVIDEVRQVHYVVGSAGEELRKTALELRKKYSQPRAHERGGTTGALRTIIICTGIGVLALAIVVYFRVRRARAI